MFSLGRVTRDSRPWHCTIPFFKEYLMPSTKYEWFQWLSARFCWRQPPSTLCTPLAIFLLGFYHAWHLPRAASDVARFQLFQSERPFLLEAQALSIWMSSSCTCPHFRSFAQQVIDTHTYTCIYIDIYTYSLSLSLRESLQGDKRLQVVSGLLSSILCLNRKEMETNENQNCE